MPSEKAARVAARRRARNQPLRTKARTFVTKARRLIPSGDVDAAERAVRDAVVALDKAAQKGVLHPNNASRRKSRIMKQLQQAKRAAADSLSGQTE